MKPTLVIMAAGMGSRYGGLKQIDPVGPFGEKIIDYSVYDAIKAGFEKVVFIIKEEIFEDFKEAVGSRIEKQVKTEYVFQRLDNVPAGFAVPADRKKPWGTGHAVLSCMEVVHEPFAVINSDDYYGDRAFRLIYEFLTAPKPQDGKLHFCMAGFILRNTLTENGHVARGICGVDKDGFLQEIVERTRIERIGGIVKYTENGEDYFELDENACVSMNCWGFTEEMIGELDRRFAGFLKDNRDNILKAEYFLPSVVDALIKEGRADVKVLKTEDKWYGVTYREDKEKVMAAIREMIAQGKYPERLWK